jgi:magnesium transporter
MTDPMTDPATDITPEAEDVTAQLRRLLEAGDAEGLAGVLDPLPISDGLRELLALTPDERNAVLSLVPP